MKARRYNKGKIRLELIPPEFEYELARVYTMGAEKYTLRDEEGNVLDKGDDNWKKGLDWREVLGSVKRHINAFQMGEDYDMDYPQELVDKYGPTLHLANACWGLATLIYYFKHNINTETR